MQQPDKQDTNEAQKTLHQVKFKKNIALLAIIFGLIALIWAISMIKISGAS
ncbi:MAG: hypothetical protein KTR28_05535 [Micavibrio sp.]|nr:hypothetical protein [Micavibrio sp.]